MCDHVPEAFRSGNLGDAEQNAALSVELRRMADTASPDGAAVLRPLVRAAEAIAAAGLDRAPDALQQAENRAYRSLTRSCVEAGSALWIE